jgi:hypothetical protein
MLRSLANATSVEVEVVVVDIGDDADEDDDDDDERILIKSNTSSRSMKKLLSDVAVDVVIFHRRGRDHHFGANNFLSFWLFGRWRFLISRLSPWLHGTPHVGFVWGRGMTRMDSYDGPVPVEVNPQALPTYRALPNMPSKNAKSCRIGWRRTLRPHGYIAPIVNSHSWALSGLIWQMNSFLLWRRHILAITALGIK